MAGVRCGIKQAGRDLALLVADAPAVAAGVFTRSTVPGAPVVISRERIRRGRARAIVVNSGCSNVAMGERGLRDARAMAALAADAIGCAPEDVLVSSTGVIGEPLPMAKIRRGVADAVKSLKAGGLAHAAEAILTTDTRRKIAATQLRVGGRRVTIAGIAKGSGMIEPNMATMLGYVLTDVAISPAFLRRIWREVAHETWNRVTIDGESSTSDTAIVLASGVASNTPLRTASSAGAAAFTDALRAVCTTLARALARDGEGATKLVTVTVRGARSESDATRAAKRVANSVLVKTALFGGDANWGRILQTIGAGLVPLDLAKTEVTLAGVPVFRAGASTGPAARARAQRRLRAADVAVEVSLGRGRASATVWTCDLSYDYVRINAEYRT